MCTLTVYRSSEEILATMNRDETLIRGPEVAPSVHRPEGDAPWMAPRDSDKGGTWMGVNAHGVIACLLNAYLPGESLLPDTSGKFPSRGEIIPALLEAGDGPEGLSWLLQTFNPEAYPSFTLLVVTPEKSVSYEWLHRGSPEVVEFDSEWFIRSSAGWDSQEIRQWREDRFAKWQEEGCEKIDTLPTFHILQDPDHLEWSPLMRRDWSATRSITQASVSLADGQVDMRYWPEPTCDSKEPGARLTLSPMSAGESKVDARAT